MSTARSAIAEIDGERVEEIVGRAREMLRGHYRAAASPRFPFGIHHASARVRIREPLTRRHLKQSEISAMLAQWALEHGGAESYAWQSVALATEELASARPSEAAEALLRRAKRALGGTPPFLEWMKNRLLAAKQPQVRPIQS